METLEQQILAGFKEELMSCLLEYPASLRVLPGSEKARAMSVGSGRQCSMLFEESSPLGAFSKILLESLHWTNSQEFCYVWERLDTRFALSAFQLTPLGQSTEDNGSSLLGTPTADQNGPNGQKGSLRDTIELRLWPTPTTQEAKHGNPSPAETARKNGTIISAIGKLWPTPTERDWKSTSHGNQDNARPLSEVAGLTGSGSLNVEFVCQLMGYPTGWTQLE